MKNLFLKSTIAFCLITGYLSDTQAQNLHENKAPTINTINVSTFNNKPQVTTGMWTATEGDTFISLQFMDNRKNKAPLFIIENFMAKAAFAQMAGSSNNALVRDAGTITFSGNISATNGTGNYQFTPSTTFESYLNTNGINEYEDKDLFFYFLTDINKAYVDGVKNEGYSPTIKELTKLAHCGVPVSYISEISNTNYKGLALNMVAKFYIHGVNREYLSGLDNAGYGNIDADMVKKFAIHSIGIKYLNDLSSAGYGNMEADMVKKFAIHSIDADYIKSLLATNIKKPSANDIKKAKIHNVSAKFVSRAQQQGNTSKELSDFTRLKIRGSK